MVLERADASIALYSLNGALDEWLSLRSAKPSTAVRIRQAPLKERMQKADGDFHQPFSFHLVIAFLEDVCRITYLLFIKPFGEFLLGLLDDSGVDVCPYLFST